MPRMATVLLLIEWSQVRVLLGESQIFHDCSVLGAQQPNTLRRPRALRWVSTLILHSHAAR